MTTKLPLDFRPPASVIQVMPRPDTDPCRRFARLTALLEDAAALAAEGQSRRRTDEDRARLAAQISAIIGTVEKLAQPFTGGAGR